jgi:hypothetical protein
MAKQTNFVVLIGGPGTFEPCDRIHDQTWSNYVVPIQIATKEAQIDRAPGEVMHWWVYAPAYRDRWADDVSDVQNPALDRGRELLDNRQKAINKVKDSGAKNYLDRIAKFSGAVKARYTEVESPADFWKRLGALPAGSVTRLWYIGHASPNGLMLKLMHTEIDGAACQPAAADADMIYIEDIGKNSSLISRALSKNGRPSKFYGCHTKAFAEQWNSVFSVGAEGAIRKIDFTLIDQPSTINHVLPRLEGKAGWQSFPKKP